MKMLLLLAVVAFLSSECSGECETVTLQESIDYTKIAGLWHQYRYTEASEFNYLACYNIDIFNVDPETKTFEMASKFTIPSVKKNRLTHGKFMSLESKAHWGKRVEGKPFIGDHLATDYGSYLLLYQCDQDSGEYIIDLEIRPGLSGLTTRAVEEIESYLARLGVTYYSLVQVDQERCSYPAN